MGKLDGRVAIITGGANGIGLAAAKRFVAEGANVLLVDLEETALQRAVAEVGPQASALRADVAQAEDVARYVRTCCDRYGGVDISINNAGIEGAVKPIPDYPLDVFERVMAVNVRGVWLGLKYVIPEIAKRGGGSIVITSSLAGVAGTPGVSAYVASKHAVVGLMRTAALECARFRIRVNTVNPSPIDTRMVHALEEGYAPGGSERVKQKMLAAVPLRRYGTPEEVAALMLFLASEESAYCTGGVYMVDGGMSAS